MARTLVALLALAWLAPALARAEASAPDARSSARADARKTILLLTDGKPSLPFDRRQADAAASWAGRMAAEAGTVVNAFAIGRGAVSRSENEALERIRRETRCSRADPDEARPGGPGGPPTAEQVARGGGRRAGTGGAGALRARSRPRGCAIHSTSSGARTGGDT